VKFHSATKDIGSSVGVSWQTAQIHLFKLQSEGKVRYRKVGRQNQRWLEAKYRKEFGQCFKHELFTFSLQLEAQTKGLIGIKNYIFVGDDDVNPF
jgi:predicted ArsR family transcriptional regulator